MLFFIFKLTFLLCMASIAAAQASYFWSSQPTRAEASAPVVNPLPILNHSLACEYLARPEKLKKGTVLLPAHEHMPKLYNVIQELARGLNITCPSIQLLSRDGDGLTDSIFESSAFPFMQKVLAQEIKHHPNLADFGLDLCCMNAGAFGNANKGTIIIGGGLLTRLEEREIKAVLAHELAHLYLGHHECSRYADAKTKQGYELEADATAARVTGCPGDLTSALEKMEISMGPDLNDLSSAETHPEPAIRKKALSQMLTREASISRKKKRKKKRRW